MIIYIFRFNFKVFHLYDSNVIYTIRVIYTGLITSRKLKVSYLLVKIIKREIINGRRFKKQLIELILDKQ